MLSRVRGRAGSFPRKRRALGAWAVIAAIGVLIAGAAVMLRRSDPPKNLARVRSTLIRDYTPEGRERPARPARPTSPSNHSTSPAPARSLAGADGRCPWVSEARAHTRSSAALAAEVLARMTVEQKIGFVALAQNSPIENTNRGIPSLCIPPLTLTDGPNGIAYGARGVTQLPAAIGVAASFNPDVAYATGRVAGAEARGKGLDVVQGPELNLARVPQSGRTFEAYGEDPYLAGVMGVANVDGIQSQGVIAEAKHFTAYNEETDRVQLNQDVSERALAEIYDAPFEAVIQQAHVGSIMCSYGSLNGTNICSDASLYQQLRSWGFNGFVRSDLDSVRDPAAAFAAGLDLIKPISVAHLTSLVDAGAISMATLDAAVSHTLTAMFGFGLIASPRPVTIHADVAPAADAHVALQAAEDSMVLLKNKGHALPLTPATRTIAVIGSDAGPAATTSGRGSSQVRASSVVSPIHALRAALGRSARITYTPADSPRLSLPPIPARDLIGTPLPTQTPIHNTPGGPYAPQADPGTADLHLAFAPNVTPAAATASSPGTGPGWSSWSAGLRVPVSGTYEFSIEQNGDTWFNLDGQTLIASPGLHSRSLWSTTAPLVAGRTYRMTVRWFAVARQPMPQLGFADVTPAITAAVNAARHASVAVIFAGVSQGEGVDRPSLYLPGDADALISGVAAVNRRTVVVVNTGGAVLMPWINHVAAVLVAWYPGQEDGAATAAVLDGQVDPSGHLPLTFPAVSNPSPVGTAAQFPGAGATVNYSEGLDMGYRWYQANHVTAQFPFGFGLTYTSFTLSDATIQPAAGDEVIATVTVTNTGARAGTAVVQAYLRYPDAAGEPPDQLRAFTAVTLDPGQSRVVYLSLARSAFLADINGSEQVVPGMYSVDIGQSSADLGIHLSTAAP